MRLHITDTILLASSVILSHAVWTGSRFVPIVYHVLLRNETDANIRLIMPSITRIASDFAIIFVMLICLAGITTMALSRSRSPQSRAYLLAGVSGQCLIAWLAAFCFCFESFTGAMSLHHASRFEFPLFLSSVWGFFPVTFLAILLPLITAVRELFNNRRPNQNLERTR